MRRFVGAVAMAALLSACANQAENVLLPFPGGQAAMPPGAHQVDMLVATTRQPLPKEPGQMFSGERAPNLAYADVTISIPPDANRKIGDVQWPSQIPGDPKRDFVALASAQIDRGPLLQRLRQQAARQKGRVLLFVHGYNNTFDDAVMRFAQIAHDSKAPAAPFLFTWPSRGRLLEYFYDHESATYSRDALETIFDMLAAEPAVRDVSIVAHSMGNWVTLEALRQSAIRRGRINAKISNVILAAPDVDVDVFAKQIVMLGEPRPRLTLFVSRDDEALGMSRRIGGGIPRIGAVNPDVEPYRSELLDNKIAVFDLTKLKGGGTFNHDKFATSPQIVRLIGGRLIEGQQIGNGRISLGDGIHLLTADAISTVGNVVGGVASAPVKILEGNKQPFAID